MNTKKIIFSIGLTSILIFSGCSKSNDRIGDDNAIQVAIDEANANNSDVKNLSCDETDKGYIVSFDIEDVQYVYKIAGNGIIENVKTKTITDTIVEKETDSKKDGDDFSNTADQTNDENSEEETDSSQTDIKDENTNGFISEDEALNRTLEYLQINTDSISNLNVALNEADQVYVISYNYDSFNCSFTVNALDGSLINIIVQ